MKDRETRSGSGLTKPRIFMSATSAECSDAWYEQEYISAWESLADGYPFFTEIVSTVTERFFFSNIYSFAVRINIFESNDDMLRWLNAMEKDTAVDVCYTKLK